MFLAFLVKLPGFIFHLWLPKAHVEAPAYGSIILAAVLLKLGGAGLIRVAGLIQPAPLWVVSRLALIGVALISLICCGIFDIKMIVAYSSVAHIGLVALIIFSPTRGGLAAGVFVIVTHAFASSGLFLGVTLIYLNSASRRSLINKGLLSQRPKITLVWALICIARIATPPLINLFAEVSCFLVIVNTVKFSAILVIVAILSAGAYSLVLYRVASHARTAKGGLTLFYAGNL
jgi:NADH-ubiquinone oxidoreductase chain 4